MTWLLAGPILLLLGVLAAVLPYASFRRAAHNRYREDGVRSTSRSRRELYHLSTFLRNAVYVPLVAVILLQGAAFVVHHYVIPDTTLSELFGEYHPEVSLHAPDLDAWNEAIEAEQRDREYAAWQQAQGLALATEESSVRETLVEHWPLHLVYVLLPLVYLAWFISRRYFAAAQRYHRGVTQRAKRYALRSSVAL